jgi:polysaccharide deacetylase 2 family uncharacterized protein YibQ
MNMFVTINCLGQEDDLASIVLIVDDMGNSLDLGQRAINLPGAINYAFLPHSPHRVSLANMAFSQMKEVMLHAPMSNLNSHPTGPGGLTPDMSRQQFLQTLSNNLEAIPHVRGVNNHMGSLMTQLRQPMDWLMTALKQQDLYFVDSRTTPLTVAKSTATKLELPSLRRDIFLDNKRQHDAIAIQFEQLITLAKKTGTAVGIGHPHPETLEYLEQVLPTLEQRGVKLILASQALKPGKCDRGQNYCSPEIVVANLEDETSAKN